MFKYILLIVAIASIGTVQAQNKITFHIKNTSTNELDMQTKTGEKVKLHFYN